MRATYLVVVLAAVDIWQQRPIDCLSSSSVATELWTFLCSWIPVLRFQIEEFQLDKNSIDNYTQLVTVVENAKAGA